MASVVTTWWCVVSFDLLQQNRIQQWVTAERFLWSSFIINQSPAENTRGKCMQDPHKDNCNLLPLILKLVVGIGAVKPSLHSLQSPILKSLVNNSETQCGHSGWCCSVCNYRFLSALRNPPIQALWCSMRVITAIWLAKPDDNQDRSAMLLTRQSQSVTECCKENQATHVVSCKSTVNDMNHLSHTKFMPQGKRCVRTHIRELWWACPWASCGPMGLYNCPVLLRNYDVLTGARLIIW